MIKIKRKLNLLFNPYKKSVWMNSTRYNWNRSNSLKFFLNFSISSYQSFFLPLFCIVESKYYFYDKLHHEIAINILKSDELKYKSPTTLFNKLFEMSFNRPTFNVIVDKEDKKYYIGNGIISTEDFKDVLLIIGTEAHFEHSQDNNTDRKLLKNDKVICYINPCVFESSGTIEKMIVNKILPCISTTIFDLCTYNNYIGALNRFHTDTEKYDGDLIETKVIIENINHFIRKPKVSYSLETERTQNDIWKFLKDTENEVDEQTKEKQ